MMERDAVSAGVSEIGGLFSTAEVRILICYLLSSINKPVPVSMLGDMLHYEGIANCFEVSDSVAALTKNGLIEEYNESERTYVITEKGRDVSKTLHTSLSMTVKQRALNATVKMVAKFVHSKETDIKITREGTKTFINCTALDGKEPFMSVKLMVGDEDQAVYIKEKFLENPAEIYTKIIEMLTK